MKNNRNFACRIFKEQIDLIQQLPENERAEVLYKAILSAFNQIENQNDIQIENQNENAYVSVSDSVSVLSKTVYSLLEKNIVCKEFSNNYGGRRIGAGRGGNHNPTGKNQYSGQSGQTGQSGQNGQKPIQTQTETETETETEDKVVQIDFNHRESFMRADPKSLVDALKRDIVPNLCAYLYTGKEPTDEQLNNYVQMRTSTGWEKKGGTPIRSIGADLASWLKREKEEQPQRNEFGQLVFKMSDKPMTYEEMIAQTKE